LPRYQASATGWREASYSNPHGICVEIARTPAGGVAVRYTTGRGGPALSIRAGAWLVFAAGLKRG
jgi:hypothetical protein